MALDEYAIAAAALDPPRSALTWQDVVNMPTLADFDLLWDVSKNNILTKTWTDTDVREAMAFHFRLKRAREEIHRLNVEIQRQTTYMQDEYVLYTRTVNRLQEESPDLASYIKKEASYKNVILSNVAYYLIKTSTLPNFSGTLQPGRCKGAEAPIPSDQEIANFPNWLLQIRGDILPMAVDEHTGLESDNEDSDADDESNALLDMAERLNLV